LGPQSIDVVTGAISDALDRADAGEIGAIAMTGTGKVFLAGADLSMFTDPTAAQNVGPMTRAAHDLQMRVLSSPVPILAHLNGVALGGGLEVALMADVRTAAPEARGLAVPETSLGILPGWGGTTLLQSVVGPENAVRMILEDPARDRQLTAEQALDSGLVDALAPDLESALDDFAALVAARLDQNADERPASDDARLDRRRGARPRGRGAERSGQQRCHLRLPVLRGAAAPRKARSHSRRGGPRAAQGRGGRGGADGLADRRAAGDRPAGPRGHARPRRGHRRQGPGRCSRRGRPDRRTRPARRGHRHDDRRVPVGHHGPGRAGWL